MKVDQLINDQLVGKIVKYNWKDGENVVGEIPYIRCIPLSAHTENKTYIILHLCV